MQGSPLRCRNWRRTARGSWAPPSWCEGDNSVAISRSQVGPVDLGNLIAGCSGLFRSNKSCLKTIKRFYRDYAVSESVKEQVALSAGCGDNGTGLRICSASPEGGRMVISGNSRPMIASAAAVRSSVGRSCDKEPLGRKRVYDRSWQAQIGSQHIGRIRSYPCTEVVGMIVPVVESDQ